MALGPTAGCAQSGESIPPVFRHLEGNWVGEGTLMGRSASFGMTWRVTSPGEIRLDFANGFVGEAGAVTPVLEAVALYSVRPDGTITADWTDSRPQQISIAAQATDTVLLSDWTAAAERGRTEYAVLADGTLRVRDWVVVGGELRPFGDASYRRRDGG
jgi:hypothetical protein